MDAPETWMIAWFTPNQTTTLPKWMVLPKTFLQIILAAKWLLRHSSIRPLNSSDDLCLLFCLILHLWFHGILHSRSGASRRNLSGGEREYFQVNNIN